MINAVIQQKTNTATEIMSLEEFLNYDDGTDARYELEDGRLLFMPSGSEIKQKERFDSCPNLNP